MKKSKEEIITYRLARFDEDLKSAQFLIANQYWEGAVNRLYCAVYHAVSALWSQSHV